MRRIIFSAILLFSLQNVCGQQHDLSDSRQTSLYTYIYSLTPGQAAELYRTNLEKVGEDYLLQLIDSMITNTPIPYSLPAGNYLFVNAVNNRLQYDLKTIGDLQLKLINNNRDLVIALHNKEGKLINDATVFVSNKRVPFDPATTTYRLVKRKRNGLIRVVRQGVPFFFTLSSNKRHPNLGYVIANSFPVKYIAAPIRKLKYRSSYYRRYFDGSTEYEHRFNGYLIFNKPVYKPGDTVKLKAFASTRHGKPVNRAVIIRLTDQSFETDTILAHVAPYRPGGYDFQFVLNDSLKLQLDSKLLVTIEELKSVRYDLARYDGDLDQDEFAAKRKVILRGKFDYEEYELQALHFLGRVDKTEHQRGNPVAVYLQATDENELPVPDARIHLTVTADQDDDIRFYHPSVYLPDTLWSHSQLLESTGETKIIIPDSLFPAASFSYNIYCNLLNSTNELKTKYFKIRFQNGSRKIYFHRQSDKLNIAQLAGQVTEKTTGILYAFNDMHDTISSQKINLPLNVLINPFVASYEVTTDSCSDQFDLRAQPGMIGCNSYRTRDSVLIKSSNENHLFFWYCIFAGEKIIARGYSDSLNYHAAVKTKKNYFVSLQYIYAGKVLTEDYTIAPQNKLLTISSDQPPVAYPGETQKVTLAVTGTDGKPVENADITAFAFTKKFEDAPAPHIGYTGKIYPGRRINRNFYGTMLNDLSEKKRLNWERWSREMGLDSIEYFRFLHPDTIYSTTEPVTTEITQLAPFIVIDGDLQPVHQLYIDEIPFFFSQSDQLKRYSFPVSPGWHSLSLRTNKAMVKVDSIWITKGMKTIVSVNAKGTTTHIQVFAMPDTLTTEEKFLWSKYMILIENTFGENFAAVLQHDKSYLLRSPVRARNWSQYFLAGPFTNTPANLYIPSKSSQAFDPEGNYVFNIAPGLIREKQYPEGRYPFSSSLSAQEPGYDFTDLVLTKSQIDSLWTDYLDSRSASQELFRNNKESKRTTGKLLVKITTNSLAKLPLIKNLFLFREDEPDFIQVYKGESRQLGELSPGRYRLLLLLRGDDYVLKENLEVRANGVNYYELSIAQPVKKDSLSLRIAKIIEARELKFSGSFQDGDLGIINERFNHQYLDVNGFTSDVSGHLMDDKGENLAGVTVLVKRTNNAVLTDQSGRFYLKVPPHGVLVFSLVGFNSEERRIEAGHDYEIVLKPAMNSLQEVVVTALAFQKSKSATSSFSSIGVSNMLSGKTPGIIIRGMTTLSPAIDPIIVINGFLYPGTLESIDPSAIISISRLNTEDAIILYGSIGVNGAWVIKTRSEDTSNSGQNEPGGEPGGNQLRRNFHDDGWWQTRLKTDRDGKTSFNITLPDDITKWRTFVIASGNHGQTGMIEKSVRSFKTLSANLSVPSFITAGDSMRVIGKTLNYSADSIHLERKFSINDQVVSNNKLALREVVIDTFLVSASETDSLKLTYTIRKGNGYFDGEERSIPVFSKGVLEAKGFFESLDKDTLFSFGMDPAMGPVKISAVGSVFPVLLEETETIRRYEYFCNEQLASKLKALLVKEKIYGYLGLNFIEKNYINRIIALLNKSKTESGLWGWWSNNEPVMWISVHVIGALVEAEQAGYKINLNKIALINYLLYVLDDFKGMEKLQCLMLLNSLNAKVNFQASIDSLTPASISHSLSERLLFLKLKQDLKLPVSLDSVAQNCNRSVFGNCYWGRDATSLFDNAIQNTLLVYKLLETQGGYEAQLRSIRNYFMEKRMDGKWRNTYESSMILETILPGLLKEMPATAISSLTINDGPTVRSFPFEIQLPASSKIQVAKSGPLPLYFTASQQYWNTDPIKVDGNFKVTTSFVKNGEPVAELKAGEPVNLTVNVVVKEDAQYTMIEIPIPAGCSYRDKNQSNSGNEAHREYFKNKVCIFSGNLRKGDYVFNVSLLPRYTGTYQLNPAKAEMMYFPLMYGREKEKTIRIR